MKKAIIIIALIWGLMAMSVSVGIYFTKNINCLWFMLIPAFTRVCVNDNGLDER